MPQAQLDRFLLKVVVNYPNVSDENQILELAREEEHTEAQADTKGLHPVISHDLVFAARSEIRAVHMSAAVQEYLVQLVAATRNAGAYNTEAAHSIADDVSHGASPRATIALDRCARARAWIKQRDYVTPDDIQALVHDCLRHRIVLSLQAQSRAQTSDQVIDNLLSLVPVG